jgi:hypothetical protein
MAGTPGPVHFEIPCYSDWAVTFTWYLSSAKTTPKDLSTYTARLDFRRKKSDTSALASLTSGSGITLGGSAGTIVVALAAATTADITPGWGYWDLEIIDASSNPLRLVEGTAEFTESVTRN